MKYREFLMMALLGTLMACTSHPDGALSASGKGVSVSVHGVNYTANPFTFVVVDPSDESNIGGGEHIGPFSAGGIMCCFTLPKKWKAGMKVQVRSTHWLPKNDKGELPEVETVYTVDVPPYANGKVGELWVLRTSDGGIEVVSTDLQPDHPQWPGKVKGWPVPSKEYVRERWALQAELAKEAVETYRRLIGKLEQAPEAARKDAWAVDSKYMRDEVAAFKGPLDPAYALYLRNKYGEGLRAAQIELEQLMKEEP
ncbi:DUF3304 domain-containing protein [Massilia sp. TN1-12]|uniref:DUF3304 domain-containing protein n=1 Tax=Massilia paldalensis TaxID=3377675 RepID=UPI00384C35C7